jgi:hypothetical protein
MFFKYVLLLFAVGFFAHSGWLYWFAYSTGSPFGEVVGPYHRAHYHVMWALFCLAIFLVAKLKEDLDEARAGKDPSE